MESGQLHIELLIGLRHSIAFVPKTYAWLRRLRGASARS
jgi:hypothetical protein